MKKIILTILVSCLSFSSLASAQSLTALENFLHKTALDLKIESGAYYFFDKNYEVHVRKEARVNTESHTVIRSNFRGDKFSFEFAYDDMALKNPGSLLGDFAAFVALTKKREIWTLPGDPFTTKPDFMYSSSPIRDKITLAELISNLNAGSPTAKAIWNSLKAEALATLTMAPTAASEFGVAKTLFDDIRSDLFSKQDSLNKEARAHSRAGQKAIDNWRAQTGALDRYEAQTEKLNNLVLNNDRTGVRKMLEAYLPWAVMEPTEAKSWKIWLEAIEHPDKTNTTVAFRGLDFATDFVQTKKTAQGNEYGFFSTVLTQNQGSYTRRLRSLSTNRLKNGLAEMPQIKAPAVPYISMIQQFFSHAQEARASNFLSFSYSPLIARDFTQNSKEQTVNGKVVQVAQGGLLAVQMDSRRLLPNTLGLPHEVELLVPLIIFPDEVVAYREGYLSDEELKIFVDKVSKKTGIIFSSTSDVSPKLKSQYKREAFQFMTNITDPQAGVKSCGGIFN